MRGRRAALVFALLAPASAWAPWAHAQGKAATADGRPVAEAKPDRPPEEGRPARPPLPPATPAMRLPWERHLEVGGDFALVARPASHLADGGSTSTAIRYQPAPGWGVHGAWELFKYLRFGAYFVDAHHEVLLPHGALRVGGDVGLDRVASYSFGARLQPTLQYSSRGRVWLTGGAGWGRLEFGRMTVTEDPSEPSFVVRERAQSFVEFPLGAGTSIEIFRNWLTIEIELTGALVTGQEGEALHDAQTIDHGRIRHVGGFPVLDATFVQTVGLSLIL